MAKYQIEVCRIGYAHATIEVEASSLEEARNLALEDAPNHDFNEHDSDYVLA